MVWLLSIILILSTKTLAQTNQAKYCPSDNWVFCATEENNCIINEHIQSTTISFGANQQSNDKTESSFLFWDITNSGTNTFRFYCNYQNLADPLPSQTKGCCYRNNARVYNSSNDNAWTQIASYNQKFDTNGLQYVGYGGDGQYFYRWMDGPFSCNNAYFPEPSNINTQNINCYKYTAVNKSIYSQSTFINCGDTGGGECNTNVVPNGDSISLIQFGDGTDTRGEYLYMYAYNSNDDINCNGALFRNFAGEFCAIHNGTVFPPGVLGAWSEVQSCPGCAYLDASITEGTTSTSSEASTTEWSKSLSETVKEGVIFESVELSMSVSTSISNTVEQSYSYSSTHTCSARCGNGTASFWYMYQWEMDAEEYEGADVAPFKIYACQWICNTEPKPPKCPPSFCVDFACQTCKPYN